MGYYKYFISKMDDGYKFGLYPNNNNTQWVVQSNAFNTKQEAQIGIETFQNKVSLMGEKAFDIKKIGVAKYQILFIDNNVEIFYIEKNTTLCKKKIDRIIKNINAPLKERKE